jgi:hypothetical protein
MLASRYADVAFQAAGDRHEWLGVTVARAGAAVPRRAGPPGSAGPGAVVISSSPVTVTVAITPSHDTST